MTTAQEPTDAEVEAAGKAWQAHSRLAHPIEGLEPSCAECGYAFGWPGITESEQQKRYREHVARVALSAARAVRQDDGEHAVSADNRTTCPRYEKRQVNEHYCPSHNTMHEEQE